MKDRLYRWTISLIVKLHLSLVQRFFSSDYPGHSQVAAIFA